MATLSKRATPGQRRIMKAVDGAVRNAAHHHPEWGITDVMARSIAKRAAGTLSSQWEEVLAARRNIAGRSARLGTETSVSTEPQAGIGRCYRQSGGGRLTRLRRSPLVFLHNSVGAMAGMARVMGQTERYEAYVDVLRIIGELRDA